MLQHGVLVALLDRKRWRGVLILGPSGSGKSDLAFRLMSLGFVLVADDQVSLWLSGGRVFGRAPDALTGLMEAHGYGILNVPHRAFAAIELIVDLTEEESERMPEQATRDLIGVPVPLVRPRPREVTAAAKIRRWLMALG